MPDQVWDLWFPGAGATGLPFCRARISADVGDAVLVHAAPPRLDVTVLDDIGKRDRQHHRAGTDRTRTDDRPASRR